MIKLSNMIYMAIVMSLIVIAMTSYIGGLASSYNKTADLSSINKTIELGERIKSSYQTFQSDQPTTSFLGNSGILITGANFIWKFILLFLSLPELVASMGTDLVVAMGVPAEYVGGIYLLVIAGFILGIGYILSKVEL